MTRNGWGDSFTLGCCLVAITHLDDAASGVSVTDLQSRKLRSPALGHIGGGCRAAHQARGRVKILSQRVGAEHGRQLVPALVHGKCVPG